MAMLAIILIPKLKFDFLVYCVVIAISTLILVKNSKDKWLMICWVLVGNLYPCIKLHLGKKKNWNQFCSCFFFKFWFFSCQKAKHFKLVMIRIMLELGLTRMCCHQINLTKVWSDRSKQQHFQKLYFDFHTGFDEIVKEQERHILPRYLISIRSDDALGFKHSFAVSRLNFDIFYFEISDCLDCCSLHRYRIRCLSNTSPTRVALASWSNRTNDSSSNFQVRLIFRFFVISFWWLFEIAHIQAGVVRNVILVHRKPKEDAFVINRDLLCINSKFRSRIIVSIDNCRRWVQWLRSGSTRRIFARSTSQYKGR